jgi:hypothetical protein
MASISSSRFSIYPQATAGTTPAAPTATTWYNLNVAKPGVSGGPANQTVESQLIRNNRNPAGIKLVGPQSALSIPFETQVPTAASDAFWELLKASIYAPAAGAAQSTAGWTWTTTNLTGASVTGFEIGDVVRITDAASATWYARVVDKTTDLTIDISKPAGVAVGSVTVKRGVTIKNGDTQKTFAMLRSFYAPASSSYDRFELFNEETIDSCSFALSNKGIITGTFGTVGIGSSPLASTLGGLAVDLSAASFTAAPTTEVVDATNNVPMVNVAGAEFGVQTINFSWQNNSQARSNVGEYTASSISVGDFRGSGQFTAYFDNIAEFNKALSGTASSMYVVMENTSKQALCISIPRVRYGNPTLNGQDRDVIATLPFQFEEDSTEAIGIRISFIV